MKPRIASTFVAVSLGVAFALPYLVTSHAEGQGQTWKGIEKFPPAVAKILKSKACLTCHQIGGVGIGKLGPNLRFVGNRRSKAWLKRWMENPPAMKPGTAMPPNQLTAPELEVMVSFLAKRRNYFNAKKILVRYKSQPKKAGERLSRSYDCRSCHKIGGRFGTQVNTAPDLKDVSKRRSAAWLKKWLRNPQAVKRGTFMPKFGLSTGEINALVAYLQTL